MLYIFGELIYMYICWPVTPLWVTVSMERNINNNSWLSCRHLCSRALSLSWEAMARCPEIIPGPFAIDPSGNQSGDSPLHVGEIPKSSPRRTHCQLWVCFFGWELKGTGTDEGNTTYSTTSPTSELFSKVRLPYACIIGFTMTPPLMCCFVSLNNFFMDLLILRCFLYQLDYEKLPWCSSWVLLWVCLNNCLI